MNARDQAFMRRAIALAQARHGRTGDNPSVGCVLVRDGEVIAEAATAEGGRPHAEEQALVGIDAAGATAYVTLEPCGERRIGTPSCSQLLAGARVARVVIACDDPSPFASGRGSERLEAAGVVVEVGVLAEEAEPLYREHRARLTP